MLRRSLEQGCSLVETADGSKQYGQGEPKVVRTGASRARRLDPLFCSGPSSSKPALVVVDMQQRFLCLDGTDELYCPEWQELIDEVEWLVCNAVRSGWKVFVLEFVQHGSTLWQISRHLEDYPLASKLIKHRCDGSGVVVESERISGGTSACEYLVCGIYADQCIRATARGLAILRQQSRVKVAASACRPWEGTPNFRWSDYSDLTSSLANMQVVCLD